VNPAQSGFIFYLNGHFFVMQMAALPATGTTWFCRFYSGAVVGDPAPSPLSPASARRR